MVWSGGSKQPSQELLVTGPEAKKSRTPCSGMDTEWRCLVVLRLLWLSWTGLDYSYNLSTGAPAKSLREWSPRQRRFLEIFWKGVSINFWALKHLQPVEALQLSRNMHASCIYTYIHTYIHVYMYIHMFLHVYIYIYRYVDVDVYIYIYIFIHVPPEQ